MTSSSAAAVPPISTRSKKLNGIHDSTTNGSIGYVRPFAKRAGRYWRRIEHARRAIGAHPAGAQLQDHRDGQGGRKRSLYLTII